MWKADGEKRTPRPKSFPPRAMGYSCEEREGSSSNGDSESTRLFSGSSSSTTGTTVSSSGNWEAFGDETEDEGSVADHDEYSARGHYDKYGAKQRVPGRSSVMMHAGGNEDEWLSETPTSRY
jgi:protein regulator of cytokinesis 1